MDKRRAKINQKETIAKQRQMNTALKEQRKDDDQVFKKPAEPKRPSRPTKVPDETQHQDYKPAVIN